MNTFKLIICTALVAFSNAGPISHALCYSGCAVACYYTTGVTPVTKACYSGC